MSPTLTLAESSDSGPKKLEFRAIVCRTKRTELDILESDVLHFVCSDLAGHHESETFFLG